MNEILSHLPFYPCSPQSSNRTRPLLRTAIEPIVLVPLADLPDIPCDGSIALNRTN